MTTPQRAHWLERHYPLTIIADRYQGGYSSGKYVAFPLDFDELDPAIRGGDGDCAEFWSTQDQSTYGVGETPQAAFQSLVERMEAEPVDSKG
jgi:hypothetical protein